MGMIHESREFRVTSMQCSSGGHRLAMQDLLRTGGRCPHCDADRHDAVIVARLEGTDYARMLMERSWYEEATGDADPSFWNHETTYMLRAVSGEDLLAWSEAPVVEALAAIHAYRVAEAKRNLRPNQRVCLVCKSIYTVSKYGHRYIDYCSRLCRRAARNGVPAIPPKQLIRTAATSSGKQAMTLLQMVGIILLLAVFFGLAGSC